MTLYEVRQINIPLTVSKPRLVAHARRIAELTRLYAAALPAIPRSDTEAFADVIPLGVALSHVRDLGIGSKNGTALQRAAWPGSGDASRMRGALSADAPRYHAPYAHGRCPIPGSRGGKCNERGRNHTRWVTNTETGEWEHREMCDTHLPAARARLEAAPDPAPNRGGVLLAAFPEVNIPDWYRWARPEWIEHGRPAPAPVVGERPTLRLVAGSEDGP